MTIKHDIHTQNRHVSIAGKDGPTVRIYYGSLEICKTEAEALEAAEILKAFFEAKKEGKPVDLIIGNTIEHCIAKDEKNVAAMKQSHPSDYQLRLERYAVDILNSRIDRTIQQSIEYAVRIVSLAKEQADKYPEQ